LCAGNHHHHHPDECSHEINLTIYARSDDRQISPMEPKTGIG
jgi:hypothetical protein